MLYVRPPFSIKIFGWVSFSLDSGGTLHENEIYSIPKGNSIFIWWLCQYRKETKSQFARDDPAFLILLAAWLIVSSAGFSISLGINFIGKNQGRRGYWAVYSTSPQSFIKTFFIRWLNNSRDYIEFWLDCSLSYVSKHFNH